MNNPPLLPDQLPDSFSDGVEQLYYELELAVMWQRPSILFAIYHSESIRKEAESILSNRIAILKQKISTILLDDIDDLKKVPDLFRSPSSQETIFFVRGMIWDCSQDSVDVYKEINKYQDLFPDNSIRVVFWIMEKEISNLIACAPEYWNFRHRAVDLTYVAQGKQVTKTPPIEEDTKDDLDREEKAFIDTTSSPPPKIVSETSIGNPPSSEDKVAENANFLLMLGISNWRENNHQKALDYILVALETTKLLQDQSFKAQCYHALALVKTGLKRFEEAIDAYQQAVSLAPEKIFPWDNLGQLYCKLGRYQEAIKAYEKAIELNPKDPFGWNGLGNAYAEIGLVQNAIAAYQKALKISPDFANAFIGQGDVYAHQGAWNDAIASYQHATRINPRLLEPWMNLGNVLQKKEQYERAIHAYRNALAVDPTIVSVWNELGNAYLKIDACEEAMDAYQKVIELNPCFGWPYANLAYANFMNGDYSKAIELFEKSIELLDDEAAKAVSWNRLGDAYRQLRNYEKALEAYQTADLLANGKEQGSKQKSNFTIAKPTSTSNSDKEKARQLEEKQVDVVNPGSNADVASTMVIESDDRENQDVLLEDANHWNTRGHEHLHSGSYDDAINAYKKAIELSPESVWAYLDNLALAYYKKGQQKGQASRGFLKHSEIWGGDDNLFEFEVDHAGKPQDSNRNNSTTERSDLVFSKSQTVIDAKT